MENIEEEIEYIISEMRECSKKARHEAVYGKYRGAEGECDGDGK